MCKRFFHHYKENGDTQINPIIQPVENAINHLPKIWVLDTTIKSLCHGADLKLPGISKLNDKIEKDQLIAIMSLNNELIALGKAKMSSKEILGSDKGLAATTDKVIFSCNSTS